MSDFLQLLRDALPEALGGLAVAAILALLGLIYRRVRLHRGKKIANLKTKHRSVSKVNIQESFLENGLQGTILVVDDDVEIISPIFLPIEEEGYSVLAATTVEQALEILRSDKPIDLIISDMILPYGKEIDGEAIYSGITVVESARKLRGNIPIMFFTVVNRDKVAEQIDHLDIAAYLRKPSLPSEVLQQVKLVLLKAKSPTRSKMVFDEIRRRKLELNSVHPQTRIRAVWALGEIGHEDSSVLKLLEELVLGDENPDVRKASMEAIAKIRKKISENNR